MVKGKIISVKGDVAQVKFSSNKPVANELLVGLSGRIMLLVSNPNDHEDVFFCLIIKGKELCAKGITVNGTGEGMSIPVGKEILGRAMNIFGEPVDGLGNIKTRVNRQLIGTPPDYEDIGVEAEIWETGIKAID